MSLQGSLLLRGSWLFAMLRFRCSELVTMRFLNQLHFFRTLTVVLFVLPEFPGLLPGSPEKNFRVSRFARHYLWFYVAENI